MGIAQNLNIMIMILVIGQMQLFLVAKSEPNTRVNVFLCNEVSYAQGDSYSNSVAYVLADLTNVTPNHGYDYATKSPYAEAVCYGHAFCNVGLNDCTDCLIAAQAAVSSSCPYTVGAQVEMVDCSIRYENYSFKWMHLQRFNESHRRETRFFFRLCFCFSWICFSVSYSRNYNHNILLIWWFVVRVCPEYLYLLNL